MFKSLYSKLTVILMAVFVAVGGIMILASQQMIEARRLLELARVETRSDGRVGAPC